MIIIIFTIFFYIPLAYLIYFISTYKGKTLPEDTEKMYRAIVLGEKFPKIKNKEK